MILTKANYWFQEFIIITWLVCCLITCTCPDALRIYHELVRVLIPSTTSLQTVLRGCLVHCVLRPDWLNGFTVHHVLHPDWLNGFTVHYILRPDWLNGFIVHYVLRPDWLNGFIVHYVLRPDWLNGFIVHYVLRLDWLKGFIVHYVLRPDWLNGFIVHCVLRPDWLNGFIVHCVLRPDWLSGFYVSTLHLRFFRYDLFRYTLYGLELSFYSYLSKEKMPLVDYILYEALQVWYGIHYTVYNIQYTICVLSAFLICITMTKNKIAFLLW